MTSTESAATLNAKVATLNRQANDFETGAAIFVRNGDEAVAEEFRVAARERRVEAEALASVARNLLVEAREAAADQDAWRQTPEAKALFLAFVLARSREMEVE